MYIKYTEVFSTDGQGTLRQYAERDVWGTLKPGTDILSGLKENIRYTTYCFDPVNDKDSTGGTHAEET